MSSRSSNPPSAEKPFSYPIEVETVPEQGLDVSISADEAARQALAKADGLPAITSLEAEFHVARKGLALFNVSGTVRAWVTQTCVVSLEPFESEIVEDVDVDFAESAAVLEATARAGSLVSPPGAPERDPPDPIIDGTIDLGALAAEFLALGLDPYPRKPGVEFAPLPSEGEDKVAKPFDVLRKLTDKF